MIAEQTAREFVISRTFDAPRDLVWKAWTERDQLMRWFGPKRFTMTAGSVDLRPGGVMHYGLRGPDGTEIWGRFVYREVAPPERLVMVNSFSDTAGGITRHPFDPAWPLELLTRTTFEERDGKTTVTVTWSPLNATDAERKTFDGAHDDMRAGWTGTFDNLAEHLDPTGA
jgi:uncharacterized protein YndB with AHSA1/START domain